MGEEAKARAEGVDAAADSKKTVKYSTRSWADLKDVELEPRVFFWGELFALGQLHVMFGQGGLGKSRISLNLARNQVLGLKFCNLPTGPKPLRHLMMGSENSIHRLQDDVRAMSINLKPDEIALLEEHVHLATLEGAEDAFINLGDEQNVRRWEATVAATRPDVVWVDPWGDILIGDGTDREVRETLTAIKILVRRVNPDAALVVMAHARTGAQNIALAGGFGAADFGKGSKALYSAARAVVNLAPYDESDNPEVVTVCAKFNDAKKYPPFKMKMNEETHTYRHAGAVDLEGWRARVKAAGADKRRKARAAIKPKPDSKAVEKIIRELLAGGPLAQEELIKKVSEAYQLSEKEATQLVRDAKGKLIKAERSGFPSKNMCSLLL